MKLEAIVRAYTVCVDLEEKSKDGAHHEAIAELRSDLHALLMDAPWPWCQA